MAIELIPRKQQTRLPRWVDGLFYVALTAFILSLLSFVVLNTLKSSAEKELVSVMEKIQQERSPDRRRLEADVLAYRKKIEDFSVLVKSHYQSSLFFDELELVTHPRVWFTEISLDLQKYKADLKGSAESFQAIGQQIAVLESEPFIRELVLSDLNLGKENGVGFSFNISFDPQILKK